MTEEDSKKIRNNYKKLMKEQEELKASLEEIKRYKNDPAVQRYIELKNKIDKFASQMNLSAKNEATIIGDVIKSNKITNSNIYVCMATYQDYFVENPETKNFENRYFKVDYNDSNASFREYINIELDSTSLDAIKIVSIEDSHDFESKNVVIISPSNKNNDNYYYEIKYRYFELAIKEGYESAMNYIEEIRNKSKKR